MIIQKQSQIVTKKISTPKMVMFGSLVIIIFSGISLLYFLLQFLLGGIADFNSVETFMIIFLPAIIAVINICAAVGLIFLKRWALYLYSVTAVLTIILNLYQKNIYPTGSMNTKPSVFIITMLILIYFWSIRGKFVNAH